MGNFIVDFACHTTRTVIEVDGYHHDAPDHAAKDAIRDEWLVSRGYIVFRVTNHDIYNNTRVVMDDLTREILNRQS